MTSFSKLLKEMQDIHDKKSSDYASLSDPYGNYHFAGKLAKLFDNPDDAGFVGRIGEKLFRLANLENGKKEPLNESVEDTETDICTITALWIASRRDRRLSANSKMDIELGLQPNAAKGHLIPTYGCYCSLCVAHRLNEFLSKPIKY